MRHGGQSDWTHSSASFTLPQPEASRDCNVPVSDTTALPYLSVTLPAAVPPCPDPARFPRALGPSVPRSIKRGPGSAVCAHRPGPRGAHPGPLAACSVCAVWLLAGRNGLRQSQAGPPEVPSGLG